MRLRVISLFLIVFLTQALLPLRNARASTCFLNQFERRLNPRVQGKSIDPMLSRRFQMQLGLSVSEASILNRCLSGEISLAGVKTEWIGAQAIARHYEKHVVERREFSDLAGLSRADGTNAYRIKAQAFAQSGRPEILTLHANGPGESGKIFRLDPKTGEFLVIGASGNIESYYKISSRSGQEGPSIRYLLQQAKNRTEN